MNALDVSCQHMHIDLKAYIKFNIKNVLGQHCDLTSQVLSDLNGLESNFECGGPQPLRHSVFSIKDISITSPAIFIINNSTFSILYAIIYTIHYTYMKELSNNMCLFCCGFAWFNFVSAVWEYLSVLEKAAKMFCYRKPVLCRVPRSLHS